jgi:ubiquinone/menaquinone biosynthesis C-methylase UbiE
MSTNEKKIQEWYSNKKEEFRATKSRAEGLEFYFTKKIIDKYISKEKNVIEIGCGTGYYGMYCADICKNYVGLDLSQDNLEVFNEKISKSNISNIKTFNGNATNIANIESNSFDLVMVLGPMYHLPADERDLVFGEAKRVCKENGIIIFAYINKIGAYLQSGILCFPDTYPNKSSIEYIFKKGTDDCNTGIIFYTTPIEMEQIAKKHDLNILKNVGVDFLFNQELINKMDEEKFNCWLEFSEFMCESERCTELSIHALLVCGKKSKIVA